MSAPRRLSPLTLPLFALALAGVPTSIEGQCADPPNDAEVDRIKALIQLHAAEIFRDSSDSERMTDPAGSVALVFRHRDRCWYALRINPRKEAPFHLDSLPKSDVQADANGRPRLFVAGGARIIPIIVRTNALAYSTQRGDTTIADVQGLADLQKLISLAGTFATGVSGVRVPRPVSPTPLLKSELTASAAVGPTPVPTPTPLPGPLKSLSDEIYKAEETVEGRYRQWLCGNAAEAACDGGAAKTANDLLEVAALSERAASYLQSLETLSHPLNADDRRDFDAFAFESGRSDFQRALGELPGAIENAPKADLLPLLSLTRGAVLSWAKSRDAATRTELASLVEKGSAALKGSKKGPNEAVYRAVVESGEWLLKGATPTADIERLAGKAVAAIDAYEETSAAISKETGKLEAISAKLDALRGGAAALVSFAARVKARCSGAPVNCDMILLDGPYVQAKWDKVSTGSFKLAADSEFSARITRTLPADFSYSYETRWKPGNLFSVGFGITFTPLVDPTFGTTAPLGTTDKVIVKTDQSSRSGQPAIFLNYRFLQHAMPKLQESWFQPTAQVGFGLTNVSMFAGVSAEMFKFLNVSYGRTWQKVNSLNGQKEGQRVNDADEILKRSRFADDYYFGVMLSIPSLPLFQPK